MKFLKKLIQISLLFVLSGSCENNRDTKNKKLLPAVARIFLPKEQKENPSQKLGDAVYTNSARSIFFSQKKGIYSIQLSNSSVKIIETNGNSLHSFSNTIIKIKLEGIEVPLKLLPKALVDIKVFPSNKFPNNDVAILCGTNNSLDIENCERSPLIKKLIEYALDKHGNVHLFRYTIGSSVIEKVDTFQQLIEENPDIFDVNYDFVVSISQGTQIANVLTENKKLKFKKHLKITAPDNGILKELEKSALNIKDFLFLLSPEYNDFFDGSDFYRREGNQCNGFKTRTDILTLQLNTANTKTDLLMSNSSHSYCANPNTTWTYSSLQTNHFNMGDEDKYLYGVIIAILEGQAPKKDLYDPRDTGALRLLSQLQNSSGIFTSLTIAPDGRTFIANVTTSDGAIIGTLTLGEVNDGGKVFIGGIQVGTIAFNGTTAVFNPAPFSIPGIAGLVFIYDSVNNQMVAISSNDRYVLDLKTGAVFLNGVKMSEFDLKESLSIKEIQLNNIQAGNLKIENIKFLLNQQIITGTYFQPQLGTNSNIKIDLASDKVFIDGLLIGSFIKFADMQLQSFQQLLLTRIPSSWYNTLSEVTKRLTINSLAIDTNRLLFYLSKDFGAGSIHLIMELGKKKSGVFYLNALKNSSYITLRLEANNNLILHIKEFYIEAGQGISPNGRLEITGGTRFSSKIRETDLKYKAVGALLLTAATNPLAFGSALTLILRGDHSVEGFAFSNIWGVATLAGATANPIFLIPAALGFFSEVEIKSNLSFNTNMILELKNDIISIPKSEIVNLTGSVNAAFLLFGVDFLPTTSLAAGGKLSLYLESSNINTHLKISGNGELGGVFKLFFIDIAGIDATLNNFEIQINTGADQVTQSKGYVLLDAKFRASLVSKILSITDESIFMRLEHLKGNGYRLIPLKRMRWDIASDAHEEGDIYFTNANGVTTIQSSNINIRGRGATIFDCPWTPVRVTGGNAVYVSEGVAECFLHITYNLGKGERTLVKQKMGETRINGMTIRF